MFLICIPFGIAPQRRTIYRLQRYYFLFCILSNIAIILSKTGSSNFKEIYKLIKLLKYAHK